jgi:hypothetical protein
VGVQRDGWGVVTRFWHLDTSDSEREAFEDDDLGFNQTSDLEMQTFDVEATRDSRICGSKLSATGGLRYASFDHSTQLNTVAEVDDDDAIYATSSLFRQYNRGTGVTGSLSGTTPIRGTFLSWFYGLRGSMLWGHGDTLAESAALVGADDDQDAEVVSEFNTTDDAFIIAETQIGLIAEHRLQCYPATAFFRAALEWQHWSGDENQSTAEAEVEVGDSDIEAEAFTAGLDMNLYGFAISTGLTY